MSVTHSTFYGDLNEFTWCARNDCHSHDQKPTVFYTEYWSLAASIMSWSRLHHNSDSAAVSVRLSQSATPYVVMIVLN